MDEITKALSEIKASLEEKNTEYNAKLEAFEKSEKEYNASTKSEFEKLANEIKDINAELVALQQKGVSGFSADTQESQSVGTQFAASDKLASYVEGSATKATQRFEANTVTTTSGGVATREDKGGVAPLYAPLRLLDAIRTVNSNATSLTFVKESAFTNNAAETAEGSEATESAVTFSEVTIAFKRVPSHVKASKQQLADSNIVAGMIDGRLTNNVRDAIEKAVILGDNTGSEFAGLATSGYATTSTVSGVDTDEDALHVLKTDLLAAGGTPAFYIMNPSDYGSMERAKGTANDHYLNVVKDGTAWNIPVVQSTHVPAGTVYLAAQDAITLVVNGGVEVSVSDSDDDNFTKGLSTILAEQRANVMIPYANTVYVADLSTVGTA